MSTATVNESRHHLRAARNLLADKGSSRWTAAEQTAFDDHLDQAERAQAAANIANPADLRMTDQEREGLAIYMRTGGNNLTAAQEKKIRAAMSTTTPAEGGYAVGKGVAAEVLNSVKGYGWMRQVATQFTTSSGEELTLPISDVGAEEGEILAENAPSAAADMVFDNVGFKTYKFGSKRIALPLELIHDASADVVGFVLERLRDRIGRTQNRYFTIGTGIGQPMGIVPAATAGKVGATGQTMSVTYDDLVDLQESVDVKHLPMPSKTTGAPAANVGWMLSQQSRQFVRRIKDGNGRPVWMPPSMQGDRVGLPMLLDSPVYTNNDMSGMVTSAKSILYGNLSSYWIRDVLGVRMLRLDDSAFALAGKVGFVAFMRSAGNLTNKDAVKYYQNSAT